MTENTTLGRKLVSSARQMNKKILGGALISLHTATDWILIDNNEEYLVVDIISKQDPQHFLPVGSYNGTIYDNVILTSENAIHPSPLPAYYPSTTYPVKPSIQYSVPNWTMRCIFRNPPPFVKFYNNTSSSFEFEMNYRTYL